MAELLANRVEDTLDGAVTAGATSWPLLDGSDWPATGDFRARCEDELVKVTARSGDTLTVVRGQEGTTAAAHPSGALVKLAPSAGGLEQYISEAVGTQFDPDAHLPRYIEILPMLQGHSASAGTWAATYHTEASPFVNAASAVGGLSNTPAITDWIEWPVVLAAGTWTFAMWVRRSTNTAIVDVSLDGGASSEGTIDTYAASADNYRGTIAGIVVPTTGLKTLRLTTDTKNGSSSDYALTLRGLTLLRTA